MSSEQIQVNCPHCQERERLSHPDGKFNLEINTELRKFRCWKCDDPKFSGSLKRLVKLYGSQSDYDTYQSYTSIFGDYDDDIEEKVYEAVVLPSEMILFSNINTTNPEHFEAYNYVILERKIPKEVLFEKRMGFCITGKYRKRIIIPSYDSSGEVNYFVSRSYDPATPKKIKYMNPKADKDNIIFNEGSIDWNSTIYLCEGAFDQFALINAGVMLGKTISLAFLLKLKEKKPNIIIILDPDAYKDSIEVFYKLHNIYVGCEEKIKIVKLPNNDDIDEIRVKFGQEKVLEYLYMARGLTIEDYFFKNLATNEYRNNRGYASNSKYFERK